MGSIGVGPTVQDKQIFVVLDESTLSGIQYLSILVKSPETPHVSYLYDCQPLSRAPNSNSIAQGLTMLLYLLESRLLFSLLLSDAAKYMVNAGAILKSLHFKLFHVMSATHLLHNCLIKI